MSFEADTETVRLHVANASGTYAEVRDTLNALDRLVAEHERLRAMARALDGTESAQPR